MDSKSKYRLKSDHIDHVASFVKKQCASNDWQNWTVVQFQGEMLRNRLSMASCTCSCQRWWFGQPVKDLHHVAHPQYTTIIYLFIYSCAVGWTFSANVSLIKLHFMVWFSKNELYACLDMTILKLLFQNTRNHCCFKLTGIGTAIKQSSGFYSLSNKRKRWEASNPVWEVWGDIFSFLFF